MRSSSRWSVAKKISVPAVAAPRPAGILGSTPKLPPRPGPKSVPRPSEVKPAPAVVAVAVPESRDTLYDASAVHAHDDEVLPEPVNATEVSTVSGTPSMEMDTCEEEDLDEAEISSSMPAPETRPPVTLRSSPPPLPSRKTPVPPIPAKALAVTPPPAWLVQAVTPKPKTPRTVIEPIVPAEMCVPTPVPVRRPTPAPVPVATPVEAPAPGPVSLAAPISAIAPTKKSNPPPPERIATAPRLITTPSPMRATLSSIDEILVHLFEAMFDLHFLRDSVEGATFCLSVALGKLPCRAGFVHLYDIDSRAFITVAIYGEGTASMLATRHGDTDLMLAAAMREQRAVVFNGAQAATARHALLGEVESVIVAPVLDGGRFLGAIELYNPLDGAPFGEREQNALTYIGERFAEFVAARGVVVDAKTIGVLSSR